VRKPEAAVPDSIVISIDAMGGDHGPSVIAPGIGFALERLAGQPVRFLLHGDEARIRAELDRLPAAAAACAIHHTDSVILTDDKPAQALRRGKGTSLWNAVEAVKSGEAQAAISAGNTGALMAISKLLLRMVSAELDRPAIVASWPTLRGVTAVLDVGANVSCDASQLVEFAIMGEAFHSAVHGSSMPTVGLLNVGSEEQKGHEEVREAHRMLRETTLPIDYKGFVEGDDIAKGTVDVIVTDGFTGNAVLKTAEGMARFFTTVMKDTFTSSPRSKLGALIAMPALKKMRAKLDPSSVNGGPLLGLNGIVVKSHGGADAKGFANAIVVAANMALSDYEQKIEGNMQRLALELEKLKQPTEAVQ
jgi:glycerol-3-phosphate acyltransferase PlsX